MNISIWWALFFMFLGGALVEWFEYKSWLRYKQGKQEGEFRRKGV